MSNDRDTDDAVPANDEQGTPKPGGLGDDGTIPAHPDGLGASTTDTASTFEPEEDEAAGDQP